MASPYPNTHSYGPPSTYNPGNGHPPSHQLHPPQPNNNHSGNNAAHPAPHQQHLQHLQHQHHQQQQQQQQQFYPNSHLPYPHSNAHPPAYLQSQGPQGQFNNNGPRQPYQPYQNPGNGGGPLMAPPTTVPDDPFKKPYLPPHKQDQPRQTQQYMHNNDQGARAYNLLPPTAQSPPHNYTQHQQPAVSTAVSTPTTAAYSPQKPSKQVPTTSSAHPPKSSMTVSAPPVTSSAQSTPTSEAHSQVTDQAPQASKLSPLDQERVDALFNVNNMLLQEVSILQQAGLKTPQSSGKPQSPQQGSQTNASSSPHPKSEGTSISPTSTDPPASNSANPPGDPKSTTPTTTTPTAGVPHQPSHNQRKFVEYMRRLQTNIFFLVSISDLTKQKPPYPSHLEALPNWLADGMKDEDKPQFEALKKGYERLRELWPDWKPAQQQAHVQQQSQNQQQQQQQQQQQPQPHQS